MCFLFVFFVYLVTRVVSFLGPPLGFLLEYKYKFSYTGDWYRAAANEDMCCTVCCTCGSQKLMSVLATHF